jgi:1-deoxy-D-xylulose-5-phosphate synthase
LHVVTKKGMGMDLADKDPERLHGVTPFDVKTGQKLKGPAETKDVNTVTYTQAFAHAVTRLAREDSRVVAITAAMPSGTGLGRFAAEFPDRFFDVGIAEQHAVTFAGALAKGGLKPVCAIYSTFLQRSQDQLIHDVALQRLNVTFCLDRAGLVGADGATHNGVFDISYLGHIPHAVIGAPVNEAEMYRMLRLGIEYPHLFALRYPRASVPSALQGMDHKFAVGEGEVLAEGGDLAILAIGTMVLPSLEAAAMLKEKKISALVCNMRFAQPLDQHLLELACRTKTILTAEEHVLTGGFGSKVLEYLEARGITDVRVKRLALPNEFIEHGSRETQLARYGLSAEAIAESAAEFLNAAPGTEPAAVGT